MTNRKVLKNDIVLVDMGIDVKGYKSDLTRMFFLGKIPPLVSQTNEFVKTAQLKAIAKIRPHERAAKLTQKHVTISKKKVRNILAILWARCWPRNPQPQDIPDQYGGYSRRYDIHRGAGCLYP